MEPRLPAHLEAAGLIRRVAGEGGFAAVLHKGDREAGTLLIVLCENGADARAYERMPDADGTRKWHCSRQQDPENKDDFNRYIARRAEQDGDLWIIELDIAQAERFIGLDETGC
ncbi:MAG: DUF1491 family protein [Novosphingobium sp.]|jgi:hypothetical protein|nr:DUF1491 family protein [Novosphingobium sp.]